MAAPIKRISDLQLSGGGGADLNPHLTALATGQFIIQWESVGGSNIEHDFALLGADGAIRSAGGGSAAASNETAQSGYGLTNGDVARVWTDTSTATNDADIRADVEDPNGGGTASFLVNVNDTTNNQVRPEVAVLNTGHLD